MRDVLAGVRHRGHPLGRVRARREGERVAAALEGVGGVRHHGL